MIYIIINYVIIYIISYIYYCIVQLYVSSNFKAQTNDFN